MGLKKNDPRLAEMMEQFKSCDAERTSRDVQDNNDVMHLFLDRETFKRCGALPIPFPVARVRLSYWVRCVTPAMVLVVRALQNQLVIPDWPAFTDQIGEIYNLVKKVKEGEVQPS